MGHDTVVRDIEYHIVAKNKEEAYFKAWNKMYYYDREEIEKIYRKKDVRYNPYFYFLKD